MEAKDDDNRQLLMRVLKEHFKDRFSLVEEALAEIDSYSQNPNKSAYRKVSTPANVTHPLKPYKRADVEQTVLLNERGFTSKYLVVLPDHGAAAKNRRQQTRRCFRHDEENARFVAEEV